ncbi:hypothetical protein [Rhodoblastus acidophilus]|uniref:hypothetical protein n=1 Tax=Rhodoblastus acidophilus TaxID=1074 RepID=UPI0011319EEF|nr:hypothetical protein [Rhodoblastus acidophilus]
MAHRFVKRAGDAPVCCERVDRPAARSFHGFDRLEGQRLLAGVGGFQHASNVNALFGPDRRRNIALLRLGEAGAEGENSSSKTGIGKLSS